MNLVFFTHPLFLASLSMPRFAHMLAEGMRERGHRVTVWSPQPCFFKLPVPQRTKKWMGYLDQFMVFPARVKSQLKTCPPHTLFIFSDQALGPWVPLVANRPHVIHCHDFLAQRSALGQIPENPTGWTGRRYQEMIRYGYTKGKHFISVSEKTKDDLHYFLPGQPLTSEVVYNGLNQSFKPIDPVFARASLEKRIGLDVSEGYILHVGGNQWYKNRNGVIEIYNAWRRQSQQKLPLLLIGQSPSSNLLKVYAQSPYQDDIHMISNLEDEWVRLAYAGAAVFLFPSLAEGFGWPIAEAMASGCPVITTAEAPMSIVAGKAGFLIPRRPRQLTESQSWAEAAARLVQEVVSFSPRERDAAIRAGLQSTSRFDTKTALDRIEVIYSNILQSYTRHESLTGHFQHESLLGRAVSGY